MSTNSTNKDLYAHTPIRGLENIQNKALVIAPFEITKSGVLDTDLMLNTTGQITFYLYRKYATTDTDKVTDLEPTSDVFKNIKTTSDLTTLGLVPDNSTGAAGENYFLGSFKMNVIFKYNKDTGTRTIEKDTSYYASLASDYVDVSIKETLNNFSSLVDSHGTGAFFCVCRVEKQTKATNTAFSDVSSDEFLFMIPSSECRDLSSSTPTINSFDILDTNNKVINIMKQGTLGSGYILDVDNTNTPIDPSTTADFFGDGSNIATYLFEGNCRDENLNYNGTATAITYGAGKFGTSCATFNGTSSKISNSTLPVSDSMTISFWMNKTSFASAYETYISLGWDNSSTYKFLSFQRQNLTNTFRLDIGNGGGGPTTYIVPLSVNNTISTDGLWHHYLAIWNKTTNRVTLYKDGNPEYLTTDLSGFNAAGGVGLNIGWSGYSTGPTYSNGSMDQIRIFNRALNNEEALALYNNCINKYVIEQEPDANINDLNHDFFEDGTNVGTFRFNGNANEVNGRMIPTVSGNVTFSGNTQIDSGTTGNVLFESPFTNDTVTVSAWIYWYGNDNKIPISLCSGYHNIWFVGGNVGLNSGNGDLQGISSSGFANTWKYITAEFNGTGYGKFYVNGVLQSISKKNSSGYNSTPRSPKIGQISLFYATFGANCGAISNLRLFNRALTQAEVTALYNNANSGTNRPALTKIKSRPDFFKDGSNVATYLFNGDVKDANGTYNGTITGTATYEAGVLGQALHQEGISNYVNFNYTPSFNVPMTVSCWMKGNALITNWRNNYTYPTFHLGNGIFEMNAAPTSSTKILSIVVPGIDSTKFNHICVTINYPTVTLYINNKAYIGTMTSNTATSTYSLGAFGIGNSLSPSTTDYNGSLDTLRIFNRALNALEVQALYNEQPSIEDQYQIVESSNSVKVLTKNGNPLIRHEPENGPAINFVNNIDYFTTPGTSDFAFGTGDFTIETWAKFTTAPTSSTSQYFCGLDTTGGIGFGYEGGNFVFGTRATAFEINYAHLPTVGIWYHLAAVRQSGVMKLFINGTQVASKTNTKDLKVSTGTFYVGAFTPNLSYKFYGWIKNLHIIKGVAKYSTNFTPAQKFIKTNETVLLVQVQKPTFATDNLSKIELTTVDTGASLPIKVKDYRARDPFGDKSCVASYLFDSNIVDEVGLYSSTQTDITYLDGMYPNTKAVSFNGTTLNTSKVNTKIPLTTNKFAVSFFGKLSSSQGAHAFILGANIGDARNGIRMTNFNSILVPNIWNGSDNIFPDTCNWMTNVNTWSHYLFNVKNNVATFYINGVSKGSVTLSQNVNIQEAIIGNGIPNYTLNGLIQYFKVFNRSLTQDEVTYLYNEKPLITEVSPVSTPNQLKIDKAVFELPVSSGGYTYLGKLQFWLNNLALQIQGIKVTHLDGILKLNNIQIGTIAESTAWRDNGVGDYDAHNIILSDINNGNGTTNNIAQTIVLTFTTPIIIDKISYLSYAAGLGGSNIMTKLYYNSNLIFSNTDTTTYSTTRELNLVTTYSSKYIFTTTVPAQKFYIDAPLNSRISNLSYKTYTGSDATSQGYRMYPNISIKDRTEYDLGTVPTSKKYYLGTKYRRNILDVLQQGLKSKRSIYNLKSMYLVNDQTIQTLNKINILLENTNMIKLTERLYNNGIFEKVNAEYILENLTQAGTAPNSKIGTILKDCLLIDYSTTFSQAEINNLEANLNTFKNRARVTPGLVSVVNNKFKLQLPKILDDGNRTGEMRDNLLVFGSPSNIDKYGMAAQNGGTLPHSHIVKRDTPLNLDDLILGNPTLNSLNFKGLPSDVKFALDGSTTELTGRTILSGSSGFSTNTSILKFNNSSLYFNGAASMNFSCSGLGFGTGDFTIEGWINPTSNTSGPIFTIGEWAIRCDTSIYYLEGGDILFQYGNGTWSWRLEDNSRSTNGVMTINKWSHFVVQRKSGILEIFVNGTKVLSKANTVNLSAAGYLYMGSYFDAGNQSHYTGYISDFQIIVGRAKYLTDFTPSGLKPVKESFKSLQTDYKQQLPFTVIPLSTDITSTNTPVFANLTDITGFSSNNDIIIEVPSTL